MARMRVAAVTDGEDETLDKVLAMDDDINCYTCGHFDGTDACTAFPEDIPISILSGPEVHDKPIPGDHDIQWKKVFDRS